MQLIHVDSIWSLTGWINIPCVLRWSPCCPDGAIGVHADSTWTPHGFWTKNWLGYHQKKMSRVHMDSGDWPGLHMDSTWNLWGRVKSSNPGPSISTWTFWCTMPMPSGWSQEFRCLRYLRPSLHHHQLLSLRRWPADTLGAIVAWAMVSSNTFPSTNCLHFWQPWNIPWTYVTGEDKCIWLL